MKFNLLMSSVVLGLGLVSTGVNAAFIDVTNAMADPDLPTTSSSLTLIPGSPPIPGTRAVYQIQNGHRVLVTPAIPRVPGVDAVTATFTAPGTVDKILFSPSANGASGDVGSQDAVNVASKMNAAFGLTGGNAINPEFQPSGDLVSIGNWGNEDEGEDEDEDEDIRTITFTPPSAFNFLAVHFGQYELFFRLLTPSTGPFTISTSGKAAGLSNYRAFNTVSSVPVPAAVWLFGSGLVGLIGIRRKSKTALSA